MQFYLNNYVEKFDFFYDGQYWSHENKIDALADNESIRLVTNGKINASLVN